MNRFFERSSTNVTISEFYDNFKMGKYNFNEHYQRKSNVWSDDKRSFLIDSILKNYPMPTIFLRPKVNTQTGKTAYDVVDGKQRLEAIIGFIESKIPLTTYFSEDILFSDVFEGESKRISGLLFSEIQEQEEEFSSYIKQFWTYEISIEYLYEENEELISSVFDRLNRNGEPLTRQELRNAKYSSSEVLSCIKTISEDEFWKEKLARLRSERMENEEFISEVFFLISENRILESSPDILDDLYDKYSSESGDIHETAKRIKQVTEFIIQTRISFVKHKKLYWVTHLYGLITFAWYCINNGVSADEISNTLDSLYSEYFGKSTTYTGHIKQYKDSCSSRTRSEGQRKARLDSIIKYCGVERSQ